MAYLCNFRVSATSIICIITVLLLQAHTASASRDGLCPPMGAVLPAPTRPASSPAMQSALATFKSTMLNITAPLNKTAVSVGVKSIHEAAPLLDFHYTPPQLDSRRGVARVDADTVYRLGSISKIFPVLAVLRTPGMDLNDPVTKYLPRLRELNGQARARDEIWAVDWDEITLGALASHLGAPADMPFDLTTTPGNWTGVGFPPPRPSLDLNCSINADVGPPCPPDVFWKLFGTRPPVYAPFTTPVYSNTAFALLGWAVEAVTNISFPEYVKKSIWEPVGMSHTFSSKPDDKLGAVPVDDIWFNASIGAGEYYSSTKDVLAFAESILLHKQLSRSKTNRWLKPVAATSSTGVLVGAPWEIYRLTNITADGRLIDTYTKWGSLVNYNANVVLIPDYDLVVSILTAGPEDSATVLRAITAEAYQLLLPGLEHAGKDEARLSYAGTYVDPESNSSLTLSLDDDGPGIAVPNWTVRAADVLESYRALSSAGSEELPAVLVRARLYPTGLETSDQSAWRAVFTMGGVEELAEDEARLPWDMGRCMSWLAVDRVMYQLQAMDHLVFAVERGEGGTAAVAVEMPAYRVTLRKLSRRAPTGEPMEMFQGGTDQKVLGEHLSE